MESDRSGGVMENGVTLPDVVNEEAAKAPDALRFEVVLERIVIVYAHDIEGASAKAIQVDGVAGRYKVVEVKEVGPSALEERPALIDRAPARETQK